MPNGDGTGPMGYGPRTGRRAGYCSGYNMPGFLNDTVPRYMGGRGYGIGRRNGGRGNGWWRYRYNSQNGTPQYPVRESGEVVQLTNEEEKKILEEELKDLEQEKVEIEKRIKDLTER